MKIALIPDGAMIIAHLINKKGHIHLNSTSLTEEEIKNNENKDENGIDKTKPPYTLTTSKIQKGNKYISSDLPSGVRGRLALTEHTIENAEAGIILGIPPKNFKPMYNTLNQLILFGGVGCANEHKIAVKLIKDKNIPILELAYPKNRDELIKMIKEINKFLDNLNTMKNRKIIINKNNLNVDLKKENKKLPLNDFKEIINKY